MKTYCVLKHHAMKTYGGHEVQHHEFLTSVPDGGVFSFTPQLLYPQGKSLWYPFDRRLGGPQSQSGCSRKEEKSLPLSGIKPQSSTL
jgi:hypothetical protein